VVNNNATTHVKIKDTPGDHNRSGFEL